MSTLTTTLSTIEFRLDFFTIEFRVEDFRMKIGGSNCIHTSSRIGLVFGTFKVAVCGSLSPFQASPKLLYSTWSCTDFGTTPVGYTSYKYLEIAYTCSLQHSNESICAQGAEENRQAMQGIIQDLQLLGRALGRGQVETHHVERKAR